MGLLDFLKPKKAVYPTQLTAVNFWSAVKNSDKPVLVDFFSETCVPCRKMGPTITKFATDLQGKVNVAAFDVGQNDAGKISGKLGIRGVPTLIVFSKGKEVGRNVGLTGYNKLKEMVEKYMPES